MARVAYDRPLSQTGFRPYRFTHPYAAAHQLRGLGDDGSTLASLGFSAAQIQTILDAHASGALSDNGYTFLLQGGVPASDLDNFLEQDPGYPDASTSQSSSSAAAGVPTGSTLLYQGHWDSSALTRSPQDVLNAVLPRLAQYGLQVVSSQAQASLSSLVKAATLTDLFFDATISVRVTGPGFSNPSDVGSLIDHEVYNVTGHMPVTSSTQLTALPSGSNQLSPSPNFTQWIEQNAWMLLLGVGAVLVLPQIVRKL